MFKTQNNYKMLDSSGKRLTFPPDKFWSIRFAGFPALPKKFLEQAAAVGFGYS
jgi:hypothetical protein